MTFVRKIKRNGRIYLAEVENYRVDGRVKQRHIRYLGEEPQSKNDNGILQTKSLNIDSVKVYGPVIVLESIARELGLFEALGEITHPILALTFAHCMAYKSVSETEKWFNKSDLPFIFGCSEISKKQLFEAVNSFSELNFEELEKSIFEKLTKIFGVDRSGVIYDGTNTYLSGTRSDLAKKGKSKDGVRGRKLIQIGLGVTRRLGLPIFHQVHAGNIHDTKMFNEAIYRFGSIGVNNGLAVFDRGITSENCISKLETIGWKCLAGLPMHKGVKDRIANLDFDDLKKFRNMVIQGDSKFFVKTVPFKIGKTNGRLLILQNYLKKQKQMIDRMTMLNEAKQMAPEDLPRDLLEFFNNSGKINTHAVHRAERFDGLSFLFTNDNLSAKDAVNFYFAKDVVERCFRLSKSVLRLNPVRLQLDKNIRAHVMICYIGLSLLTTIRLRLERKGIFRESGDVLKSLESIFKIYLSSDKVHSGEKSSFYRLNTLSNHQKDLIKIIAPNLQM